MTTRKAPTLEEIEAGKIKLNLASDLFWQENNIQEKIIAHINSMLEAHNFSDESECRGESPSLCDGKIPRHRLSKQESSIVDHYQDFGYRCRLTTRDNNIYFSLIPFALLK